MSTRTDWDWTRSRASEGEGSSKSSVGVMAVETISVVLRGESRGEEAAEMVFPLSIAKARTAAVVSREDLHPSLAQTLSGPIVEQGREKTYQT
jgi:hypothetical protein